MTRIKRCIDALILFGLVVINFCVIPIWILSSIFCTVPPTIEIHDDDVTVESTTSFTDYCKIENIDASLHLDRWPGSLLLPSSYPMRYTFIVAILATFYHKCVLIYCVQDTLRTLGLNAAAYGLMYILAFLLLNVFVILRGILSDIYDTIYFAVAFPGVGAIVIGAMLTLWVVSRVLRYVTKKYVTKREALKRQKNPHPTDFHHIMAQIGSEHLYSFLEPKDLLSFSLTNHRTFEDISENLMRIAAQQMPIKMSFNRIGDIGSPERDDFTTTISISSQLTHNCPARLFEHLSKKLAKNNILIRGASSQEESNSKVVDILNEKGRVDLQLPTDSSDKARETYERFQQLSPLRMCAYFKQGLEKPRRWLFGEDFNPREKAKEILDGRMRLTWFRDQEEYKLVRHWLHFILSKKDVSKTVFLWGIFHQSIWCGYHYPGEGRAIDVNSAAIVCYC